MTHPIDTAYVDIVPEQRALRKLERDIDKAMKKVERQIEADLKEIDKDFVDTFAEIDKYFAAMSTQAEKQFKAVEKTVEKSMSEIDEEVTQTFESISTHMDNMGDDADKSFRRVRSKFLEPLTSGLKSFGGMLGEFGKTFGQLASGIGGAVGSSPLLALVLALAPAILALAAALSQLIGLVGFIPAGLGVLVAAILPVVIAFQNFGDAISAVASGDLEKIDEALKKLSPSAQLVAREFGKVMPIFREFQKALQEAFFSKIIGDLTKFATVVLPVLRNGMAGVAGAVGELVHSFATWATQAGTVADFQELFNSTARIIRSLIGPIGTVANAFLRMAVQALPFVEQLASKFGELLSRFSAFVGRAINDGSFDKFLSDALTTLKELVDLIKASGGLIGTLFGALEGEGHTLLQTLTKLVTQLDKFLQSEDGQLVLDALIFSVKVFGAVLQASLDTFIFFVQTLKQNLVFLEKLGRGVTDLGKKIWEWLKSVPEGVAAFFDVLPERIGAIFTRIFDSILHAIGIGMGLVFFTLQVLPTKIGEFFASLPERAYESFKSIVTVVGDLITEAVTFGETLLVNGFNNIVEFIRSVPGRISALIPSFNSAGNSLIKSFMNGFKSVGGFIGDIAGDIVSSVKGFLNRAIDRINSGIARLDDVLPGSLARIPRLAEGGLVRHRPGGILANVGEGREDEVVAPLSKLEGMIKGGQTFNLASGAVQVIFEGVVPTEAQARTAGAAVAQGLFDAMTRQNIRTQVRAA